MGNDPNWLSEAYEQWRTLIEEGVGDHTLSIRTGWPGNKDGLTRHKCRLLIEYAKTLNADTKISSTDHLWVNDYEHTADGGMLTYCKAAPRGIVYTSAETHSQIVSAYSNWDGVPATVTEMCGRFGMSRPVMREYLYRHQVTHDHEPFTRDEMLELTVEEMAEQTVQMKRGAVRVEAERVSRKLDEADARKYRNLDETLLKRLESALMERAPAEVDRLALTKRADPYGLVVSPTDLHFGLYSSPNEVHDAYNMPEARRRLFASTEQIVGQLPGQPSEIIAVLGSDWSHADGGRPATTKGTPQTLDGSPDEVAEAALYLAADYVSALRQIAPVRVHVVPGNHDHHAAIALRCFLVAWFREAPDVRVEQSRKSRQHTSYGSCMITLHHGEVKPSKITAVMRQEAPNLWRECAYRIAFAGHLHHDEFTDDGDVIHARLNGLTGQSVWEYDSAYGSNPGMTCYLIGEKGGPFSWIRSTSEGR